MTVVNVNKELSESRLNGYHIIFFLLATLFMMFQGYAILIYGGTLPMIMKEWGISAVTAGVLGSAANVGMLVGAFLFGFLGDKIGRRKVMLVVMLFWGLGAFFTGFTSNVTQLGILRFLTGVGGGGTTITALALMSDYVPSKQRAFIMGSSSAFFMLGGILASLGNMVLIPAFGWQGPYLFTIIPLAIIFLLSLKYVPEMPAIYIRENRNAELRKILSRYLPDKTYEEDVIFEINKAGTKSSSSKSIFEDNRLRSTLMLWIVFFMCQCMTYGINAWLPKLMMGSGFTFSSGLTFMLAVNLGGFVGTLIVTKFADTYGQKNLILVSLVVAFICTVLLAYTVNAALVTILIALVGAGFFGASCLMFAYVSLFYPTAIRSTGSGYASGIGRLGGIVGPTAIGFMMTMQVPQSRYFYLLSLPMLIAFIAIIFVQEKYGDSVQLTKGKVAGNTISAK